MKAIFLKLLFVSALLCGLSGCSNDDGTGSSGTKSTPEIAGKYILVSMRSNISVDLNNDGILSTNLLTEIDDEVSPSQTDLEIKPVFLDNELVQLMSFYLPHPTLSFDNPTEPEGSVKYTPKGLGYEYQYDNATNVITVDNNNNGNVPSSGRLDTVEVAGSDQLQAIFEKYYYDFAINEWRLLTITCRYVRS